MKGDARTTRTETTVRTKVTLERDEVDQILAKHCRGPKGSTASVEFIESVDDGVIGAVVTFTQTKVKEV